MNEAVLLDTCACIWLSQGERLTESAVARIDTASQAGAVFLSPFTAWEVSQLSAAGRINLRTNPHMWFARLSSRPGVRPAPLGAEILIESNMLPDTPPRDLADRILIATARRLVCPLVTRDRKIIDYARLGYPEVVVC